MTRFTPAERRSGCRVGAWVVLLAVAGWIAPGPAESRTELRPVAVVTITASGFAPEVLRIGAANEIPVWANDDSVAHTVTFATGGSGCSVTIPAGAQSSSPCGSYSDCAKQTPFSVDSFRGTAGTLVIDPQPRTVSLRTSSASLHKGDTVVLSGTVFYLNPSPPTPAVAQPVVIRRMSAGKGPGSGGFTAIARVLSTGGWTSTWKVRLRPTATATYQVEAAGQPRTGCTLWIAAKSRSVTVVVG